MSWLGAYLILGRIKMRLGADNPRGLLWVLVVCKLLEFDMCSSCHKNVKIIYELI